MTWLRLQAIACLLAAGAAIGADCPPPLDRPLTLVSPSTRLVERHYGVQAAGGERLSFILPRPPAPGCPDNQGLPSRPLLAWEDSASRVSLLLLGGQEFRLDGEGVGATEAGGIAEGRKGPISFRADGRLFTEVGGAPGRPSFDREIIDEQSGEVTGALDYRSYARFRGDLSLTLPFGTLTAARDAVHWGPGLYESLTFSQEAVPFYQYLFATDIGPFRIASLYGDLLIGDNQSYSSENRERRSLYAHRYEAALGKDVLAGITEQLVLYDMSKPYLFAPIFPLFIAKGFLFEDNTNGSIAADLAWRSPWSTLIYGEFLLDDLESPASLFTRDYIQNKWGAMAGVHWAREWGPWMTGAVAEFSHIEPWVYAHFTPRTAQFSNLARPLGNPSGPDSRNLTAKAYVRKGSAWYGGLKLGLRWKGTGPGADQEQAVPRTPFASQESLQGEGSPDGFVEPEASWTGSWLAVFLATRVGEDPAVRLGVRVFR